MLRVTPLDAEALDSELAQLLSARLSRAYHYTQGTGWRGLLAPGQDATQAVELALQALSVAVSGHSPGAALWGLRLSDARAGGGVEEGEYVPMSGTQRRGLVALLLARFALTSSARRSLVPPASDRHARVALLCRRLEDGLQAASAVNLLAFLLHGRYSTLVHRLLRVRWHSAMQDSNSALSFQFVNRQVVWQELNDVMLFFIPLASQLSLRRRRAAVQVSDAPSSEAPIAEAAPCVACGAEPAQLPCAMRPCGHVGCYFCLAARCRDNARCLCPACYSPIETLTRIRGAG